MKTPSIDTVYKSYIDALHAAKSLRKQESGVDTMVRVEKAPCGNGYIVRSTPLRVEKFFLMKSFARFGMKMPGAFPKRFNSVRPGFGGRG